VPASKLVQLLSSALAAAAPALRLPSAEVLAAEKGSGAGLGRFLGAALLLVLQSLGGLWRPAPVPWLMVLLDARKHCQPPDTILKPASCAGSTLGPNARAEHQAMLPADWV